MSLTRTQMNERKRNSRIFYATHCKICKCELDHDSGGLCDRCEDEEMMYKINEAPTKDGFYLCLTKRDCSTYVYNIEVLKYEKGSGWMTFEGDYFEDNYGVSLMFIDKHINELPEIDYIKTLFDEIDFDNEDKMKFSMFEISNKRISENDFCIDSLKNIYSINFI